MTPRRAAIATTSTTTQLGAVGQGTSTTKPNTHQEQNTGGLGPSLTVAFDTASVKSLSTGLFLVTASITVVASNASDLFTCELRVDGAPIVGGPTATGLVGPSVATGAASLSWLVQVTPQTSHTFGVQAQNNTGGHTLVCSSGFAAVVVVELS